MTIVNRGPNTVTPGAICYSCIKLETGECPYENKYGNSTLTFKGDPGTNTCNYYEQYPEDTWGAMASGENEMKKTANIMKEAQLNMALYKKIIALSDNDANKLFNYWGRVYPENYAEDMVDEKNSTEQRDVNDKKTPQKSSFKKEEKKSYKERRLEEKTKKKFFD